MQNRSMKARAFLAAALVAAAAIAAYWWVSPFLAVREIQQALRSGDAATFNAHVDYPRVRESLKGQLSAMVAQRLGQDTRPPLAALGHMLGTGLVNSAVELLVRPETVMAALQA